GRVENRQLAVRREVVDDDVRLAVAEDVTDGVSESAGRRARALLLATGAGIGLPPDRPLAAVVERGVGAEHVAVDVQARQRHPFRRVVRRRAYRTNPRAKDSGNPRRSSSLVASLEE